MKLFFDTEFTGLCKDTSLISIGLISESGHTFYAEANDFNPRKIDEWITENVISNLRFANGHTWYPSMDFEHFEMKGTCDEIGNALREWLIQFDSVEMWSDCLAYDWVLFSDLFGGALNIPTNIYYIPFDISTLMKVKGVDPDVNREEFAGSIGKKHNSLSDAKTIKACYEKLNV